MTQALPKLRTARRRPGTCDDCGIPGQRVRTVRFWLNDMRYTVCAEHEAEYRARICWPVYEKDQPGRQTR